ncbi:MAG: nucleotidyltransferase domain-containing protein [Thermosphaera sp.]
MTSSVLTWPTREEVDRAARAWAEALAKEHDDVMAVGYFGSYARGNHGVGSDLELVVLLSKSRLPPERRSLGWPLHSLPVPADVLVYTLAEWARLKEGGTRFARMLEEETVWLWRKG